MVSDLGICASQPSISPGPTPREQMTAFSQKSSLPSPFPVRSTRSHSTSHADLGAPSNLVHRYGDFKTHPPTPPPKIPLPPLPDPTNGRISYESSVGVALTTDSPPVEEVREPSIASIRRARIVPSHRLCNSSSNLAASSSKLCDSSLTKNDSFLNFSEDRNPSTEILR